MQTHLMSKEHCEVFCREYTEHINTLRQQNNAAYARYEKELRKLERQTRRIVDAVKDGYATPTMKHELDQIVEREAELKLLLEDSAEAPVVLHPAMADRFREEVNNLVESLNDETRRTESATLLRRLIDKIVLKPDPDGEGLLIDLHGHLAGILGMAATSDKSLTKKAYSGSQDKMVAGVLADLDTPVEQDGVKMVAGAGFEPATFRL